MGIRKMLEIEAKGLVKPGLRMAFRFWVWIELNLTVLNWTERELPGAMNE